MNSGGYRRTPKNRGHTDFVSATIHKYAQSDVWARRLGLLCSLGRSPFLRLGLGPGSLWIPDAFALELELELELELRGIWRQANVFFARCKHTFAVPVRGEQTEQATRRPGEGQRGRCRISQQRQNLSDFGIQRNPPWVQSAFHPYKATGQFRVEPHVDPVKAGHNAV